MQQADPVPQADPAPASERAEPTRWLDPTESRAWRGQVRMGWLLDAAIARDLAADAGLSHADYYVLAQLSERQPHRRRMSELADGISWSRSRLSHHIGRMEARGLVRREGCPSDARGTFAVLTERGLGAIERAAPGHVASIRRHLVDQLTPAQVAQLAQITEQILDHLAAEGLEAAPCDAPPCDATPCDASPCEERVGDALPGDTPARA